MAPDGVFKTLKNTVFCPMNRKIFCSRPCVTIYFWTPPMEVACEQANQALYRARRNGRNTVSR